MTSALFSLAKVLMALAASTGSPVTNAIAVGPAKSSSRPSIPASEAARLMSVFLATAYVADPARERRSSARLATVKPRYSVIRVAVESRNRSVMSATAVALSALAMHSSCVKAMRRVVCDHRGTPNAPRPPKPRARARTDQPRLTTELGRHHAQARQELQPRVCGQRRAQRVEEKAPGLGDPPPDDDEIEVAHRPDRGDHRRQRRGGPAERLLRRRI